MKRVSKLMSVFIVGGSVLVLALLALGLLVWRNLPAGPVITSPDGLPIVLEGQPEGFFIPKDGAIATSVFFLGVIPLWRDHDMLIGTRKGDQVWARTLRIHRGYKIAIRDGATPRLIVNGQEVAWSVQN